MNLDSLTFGQLKEIAALFAGSPQPAKTSAYRIGGKYMFRTVTHIVTGRLLEIHPDGLIVDEAAWIADTGRYSDAVATGSFNEVEPYPDGARVVVNFSAMIDAVEIQALPRVQK